MTIFVLGMLLTWDSQTYITGQAALFSQPFHQILENTDTDTLGTALAFHYILENCMCSCHKCHNSEQYGHHDSS